METLTRPARRARLKRRTDRRWRRAGAAVAALLACSAVLPSAAGQDAPQFTEGPWEGVASVTGLASGTIEGVPYIFTLDLDAEFSASVTNTTIDDDNTIGEERVEGSIEGSWQAEGSAEFSTVIPGQGDGIVSWDLQVEAGTIAGSTADPSLAGQSLSTNGLMVSTAPNIGSRTVEIPESLDPIRMDLSVETGDCYELYGSVNLELLEDAIQAQGAISTFEGSWFAHLDQDTLNLTVGEWTEQMRTAQLGQVDAPDNLPGIARMAGAIINEYNAWVDELWSGADDRAFAQRTVDLMNDSAVFLARLRNLTECEAELIDPNLVQRFETLGKRALLKLGTTLAVDDDLSVGRLWQLHQVALHAGALGANAPGPEAAAFREALRERVERVLNENFVSGQEDGTGKDGLLTAPDTRTVLAFGAQMGFDVTINGKQESTRDLWNRVQAADAAKAAAAAGEDE